MVVVWEGWRLRKGTASAASWAGLRVRRWKKLPSPVGSLSKEGGRVFRNPNSWRVPREPTKPMPERANLTSKHAVQSRRVERKKLYVPYQQRHRAVEMQRIETAQTPMLGKKASHWVRSPHEEPTPGTCSGMQRRLGETIGVEPEKLTRQLF